MTSFGTHRVLLEGEAPVFNRRESLKAFVEIDFDELEEGKDYVGAAVRLKIPNYPFVGANEGGFEEGAYYYGNQIYQFVEELERLRTESSGSARLFDWDLEPVLCLTKINPISGRIVVGGQLIPARFETDAHSADNFLAQQTLGAGGVRVIFDGIITDQSYLISTITQLRRFLVETGIPNTGGW